MSICKTSFFGENRSTLQRSSQLEENILQKNLSLLRSMRRQYQSKYELESKAITKRITSSLEHSAQIDGRIVSMKCSMAPPNRRHYRIKDHSTAEILKDAWNNDDSKARISAKICTVILPIAVRLLEEQGMTVSKNVLLELEDLQTAHRHYLKRPNSFKKKRSKSLGDRPTVLLSEESAIYEDSKTAEDLSNDPPHTTSSYLTTCDLEIDKSSGQPRSIRSHTVQYSESNPPIRIGSGTSRPVSAPGILIVDEQSLYGGAVRVPLGISEEESYEIITEKRPIYLEAPPESHVMEISAETTQNINTAKQALPDVGRPNPDENTVDSECSLRKLHAKLHTSLESVTLADVQKAIVATKNFPRRLEGFLQCIQKWKISTDEDTAECSSPHSISFGHSNELKGTTKTARR